MVNFVAAQKLLLHGLMKWAGLTPQTVEIDPTTVMNMWVPLSKTKAEDKNEEEKPAVVLIHGFAADGVMTWEFQVGPLAKKYAVYVPDLIFFGASTTNSSDRSPAFQAEMVVRALGKFGVRRCAVVGFSYGGMVATKMAELWPGMVTSLVVSGSVLALTESISETLLERIGFSSWSEMLLPNSVKGVRAMFSITCNKKLWFPDRLFRDYLQVMFTHRKEREELLESLVISNNDLAIPHFSQPILLLWGENDQIFNLELAKNMKERMILNTRDHPETGLTWNITCADEYFNQKKTCADEYRQLGDKVILQGIRKQATWSIWSALVSTTGASKNSLPSLLMPMEPHDPWWYHTIVASAFLLFLSSRSSSFLLQQSYLPTFLVQGQLDVQFLLLPCE